MKYHHEGSFRQFYPFGVTDAQYSDSQSIILVAGSLLQESHAEVFKTDLNLHNRFEVKLGFKSSDIGVSTN